MDGPQAENGVQEPRWIPPQARASGNLLISNSMCRQKVKFQEHGEGRQVTWYICGPTVYDVAHVGHARNYVTSDIMRRILEDYFNYDLFYVMNVTDVDDKIIKRARRNHLLGQYIAETTKPEKVAEDAKAALSKAIPKQQDKVEGLKQEAALASGNRQKELLVQVKQEELKLSKLEGCQAAVEQIESSAVAAGPPGVKQLVEVAEDVLAEDLDSRLGGAVTDHSIFRAHSSRYEREFFEDMAALGCRPPDVLTRVTEYVPAIVTYIEKIVAQDFAYPTGSGNVYFDTESFKRGGHEYGKLCPWAVGSATLAAESEQNFETTEKRNKNDFALWKASKPGEPFWESPWGQGRPGWHIECSAMASELIGQTVDIHSGGADLKFPHHENELAQAEAYFDCQQWVNYFVHPGHLHIEGLKMSKSLKNFITVQEALKEYSARQLRLLFVLQPWDKPMNFGPSAKNEMVNKEKQIKNFFQNVQVAIRASSSSGLYPEQRWDAGEVDLHNRLRSGQVAVRMALEDNFDTPRVMDSLMDIINATNKYLAKMESERRPARVLLLRKGASYVTKILNVFGLVDGREELGFGTPAPDETRSEAGAGASEAALTPLLDTFSAFRDEVRAAAREGASKESVLELCSRLDARLPASNGTQQTETFLRALRGFRDEVKEAAAQGAPKGTLLSLSDKVRDHTLVDLGVRLEDRAGASVWKLDDPETLRRERDAKAAAAAQQAVQKLENKRKLKLKELEKWDKASLPPDQLFRGAVDEQGQPKYSSFEEGGLPATDAAGKPLSAKAKKAGEKDLKKAQEAFQQYQVKKQEAPHFLDELREELDSLSKEISSLQVS